MPRVIYAAAISCYNSAMMKPFRKKVDIHGESFQIKEQTPMDDETIVKLFLSRDEAAISETAKNYGARLRTAAERICGDALTAEECENDAYMAAWNAIPPHEPVSYLYPFLLKLARAAAINRLKAGGRLRRRAEVIELSQELETVLPSPGNVEDEAQANELIKAVNAFLSSLPKEKRVMFIRRYWYMDGLKEIAGRLGVTESKVKTTLFRVRAGMRAYLEGEGLL